MKCSNAQYLYREASVGLWGTLYAPPPGKECPGGLELQVEYWELIGKSDPDIEKFNKVRISKTQSFILPIYFQTSLFFQGIEH